MSRVSFPKPRRPARPRLEETNYELTAPDEPIGTIQGQQPDSKEEWWVSRALDRLRLNYQYQYPVNGGRARGGYMIDFVVFTVPLWTMIEPIGNHWHTGELGADDQKRQADIENLMRDVARTPILLLWIPDLVNEDAVYARLRSELG